MLIRIDGAGSTKRILQELVTRRVSYSVGFTLPANTPEIYRIIPEHFWEPAYDPDGTPRDGADVAELTGLLDLKDWPEGMRVTSSAASDLTPGHSCGSRTSMDTG